MKKGSILVLIVVLAGLLFAQAAIAEVLFKFPVVANAALDVGTVVKLNPTTDQLVRATSPDRDIVGVVVGYESDGTTNYVLVASSGQYPVQVSVAVAAGDRLTISGASGSAIKATNDEDVLIGIAMADGSESVVAQIMVDDNQAQYSAYDPTGDYYITSNNVDGALGDLDTKINDILTLGGEPNQDAYSNITTSGGATGSAASDDKTDDLAFQTSAVAGNPLSITVSDVGAVDQVAIDMSQAATGSNGWLSSTDWNTFNNHVTNDDDLVIGNEDVTGLSVDAISNVLTLTQDVGGDQTVDLSHLDASGSDDQNISGSSLSGTDLTIGIETGTNETVDLSSLVNDADYIIGNEDITAATWTDASNLLRITDHAGNHDVTISGFIESTTDNWVDEAGDVMTGLLTLSADPTLALQAATKQYVDAHTDADYVIGNEDITAATWTDASNELKITDHAGDHTVVITGFLESVTDQWVDESGDNMTGQLNMTGYTGAPFVLDAANAVTITHLDADLLDGQHYNSDWEIDNNATNELITGQSWNDGANQITYTDDAGDHVVTITGFLESVTDQWVDEAGDVMTGLLTLSADPTLALQAATKQYVDAHTDADHVIGNEDVTGLSVDAISNVLTLTQDVGGDQTVDLSHLDASGSDDQNISGSSLSGTDLTIGIETGTNETVDLSSLVNDADYIIGNEDITAATWTDASNLLRITDHAGNHDVTISGFIESTTDNWVDEAGDVMTGLLTLSADPTLALQAATKQYVDAHTDADYVIGNEDITAATWTDASNELKITDHAGDHTVVITGFLESVTDQWVDESGDNMTGQLNMTGYTGAPFVLDAANAVTITHLDADLLDGQHYNSDWEIDNNATNELITGQSWNDGANQITYTDDAGDHVVTITGFLESVTDQWVDEAGDVMTGLLTLSADPTLALQAATKQYVDAHTDADHVIGNEDVTGLSVNATTNVLTLTQDVGGDQTVDLSHLNASGSDDQDIFGSGLAGNILTIGIENGDNETVDLSALDDDQDADYIIGNEDVTGLSVNATTNVLTLTQDVGGDQTVDLSAISSGAGQQTAMDQNDFSGSPLTLTATSWTDLAGVSIATTSSSNPIVLNFSGTFDDRGGTSGAYIDIRITDGTRTSISRTIILNDRNYYQTQEASINFRISSPTTGSTTYKVQYQIHGNYSSGQCLNGTLTLMEING